MRKSNTRKQVLQGIFCLATICDHDICTDCKPARASKSRAFPELKPNLSLPSWDFKESKTDEFQQEVAKQFVDETAGNIYSDLIQPTAKSIGNTLSLIPRTIGVWLGKWEKWIINGERSIELTKQAVQEKLARIPEEKLSEPEPNIAIPAIITRSQENKSCHNLK